MSRGRKFAVMIVSHGRPDNIITLRTLRSCGYKGKTYIVIDDEDERGHEYRELYGDMVIEFSKAEAAAMVDTADARPDHLGVIYARNYAWTIAERLGLTHFLVLDDDYGSFLFRFMPKGATKASSAKIEDFDRFCDAMNDFLDVSGALAVTMAQGGDFIGGAEDKLAKRLDRKAMNTWFFRTDRPFRFVGRVNEDTNAYVQLGAVGNLFFTVYNTQVNQTQTQKAAGGMTTLYLDNGTYVKSFYSVIVAPSCVTVRMMGSKHTRMHHHVKWRNAVPMILSDKWRKRRDENSSEEKAASPQ